MKVNFNRMALSGLLLLMGALCKATAKVTCGTWSAYSAWNCAGLAPNYAIYWNVYTNNQTIQVALDVEDPKGLDIGWVGIGLSEGSGMPGSDIFLFRKADTSGSWVLDDMFADDFAQPILDEEQNVQLLWYRERGSGGVRALFTRKLQACNPDDRSILEGVSNDLIWAFGDKWGAKHQASHRGKATVTLWTPVSEGIAGIDEPVADADNEAVAGTRRMLAGSKSQAKKTTSGKRGGQQAAVASSVKTLEVRMDRYPIPEGQDAYVCIDVELPSDQKYHVIKYSGIYKLEGTEDRPQAVVHHEVLYGCRNKPSTFGKGAYACTGMPLECIDMIAVTGPGAKVQVFPDEAGFPIGEGSYAYAALQVHYSNLYSGPGILDSSGFSLEYTSELRAEEMGAMILGDVLFQVPPNTERWSTGPSVCPASCTERFKGPITLTSINLHMHQAGKGMVVQHFRGDKELRPLGKKNYYDFNYQGFQDVPLDTRVVQPGDVLVTTCNYSNPGSDPISFGEETRDEMCFAYVSYYPKSNQGAEACLTARSTPLGTLNMAVCAVAGELADMFFNGADQSQLISALVANNGLAMGALYPESAEPFFEQACMADS